MMSSLPSNPSIGVVILNYNYERYVGDAIRSVLGQTDPFDEIMVVDDGSSDNSLDLIRRYEPRIRTISKVNGGPMSASIAGIEALNTDYVYLLDADDFAAANLVSSVRPHLSALPAKVQFQLSSVGATGESLGSVFPFFPRSYGAEAIRRDNQSMGFYISPPTSGNLYRRAFLLGLDLAKLPSKDFVDGAPNLVAPYFGEVVTIDRPLAFYRVHGSGHSQWGRPTTALLEREIAWLKERRSDAKRIAPDADLADSVESTVYVTERRLMVAALEGQPVGAPLRRFIVALGSSGAPLMTKAGLSAWAMMLLPSAAVFRRKLVVARRSPEGRPAFLNSAVVRLKQAAQMPRRLFAGASDG